MVTIKDVAQKAGVNPSTVSRVLKDNHSISEKTKEKVRKAMHDLGYVPNVAAQMLASGLTHNIGLVFPPITVTDRLSEPFFMQILTTITNEAKSHHFTVSIATGMTVDALEEQVKLMHLQKRVDGFIILYSEQNDPVRKYLLANKIPFVIVELQKVMKIKLLTLIMIINSWQKQLSIIFTKKATATFSL